MSILEKIYNFLDYRIEEPTLFGGFHILSLLLIAALTVLICRGFGRCSERTERRIALWCWILIVALEVYKQFNFSLSFEEGAAVWDYSWYAFPFQFCSSPMFILPLIAFLPSGKAREAAVAFMGTFSLFAGLAVCLYPADVYTSTLGICIQTTVLHGLQIVLGIFFTFKRFTSENPPKKRTYFLSAVAVFSILVVIAMAMNIAVYHALTAAGIDETFNMFYISPYFDCTLPVLSTVYELVPYPVFLVIYILGFSLVALIVFEVEHSLILLREKKEYPENGRSYAK